MFSEKEALLESLKSLSEALLDLQGNKKLERHAAKYREFVISVGRTISNEKYLNSGHKRY